MYDLESMFREAVRLVQKYWEPNPEERAALEQSPEPLTPEGQLRLLHLTCAELLTKSSGGAPNLLAVEELELEIPSGTLHARACELTQRLAEPYSPFRPCRGQIEQGLPGETPAPSAVGVLANASITHAGCLEVLRRDEHGMPLTPAFIPLGEIAQVEMRFQNLFRAGRVSYRDDRPAEDVLIPLLYGYSWLSPQEEDRDGGLTRFVLLSEEPQAVIGIGHQDWLLRHAEGTTLFGMGAVTAIRLEAEASKGAERGDRA